MSWPSFPDNYLSENHYQLSVFPNLALGLMTISFTVDEVSDAGIVLYEMTGQGIEVLYKNQYTQVIIQLHWLPENIFRDYTS